MDNNYQTRYEVAMAILEKIEEGGGGTQIEVVQGTGQSTTAVMSQKAVTDAINDIPESPITEDAPENGNLYARKDGSWEWVVSAPFEDDAPFNNEMYGRKNGNWVAVESGGLKVVNCTSAEYEAISVKDNMTIYIVSDSVNEGGNDTPSENEGDVTGLKIRVQSIPDGEDTAYVKFVFNEKSFELPLFRKWDNFLQSQANYGLGNYSFGDGDTPWAKWIPEIDGVSYDTDVYYKQEDGYEYLIYGSKVTVTYESPVEAEVISNPTVPVIG